MMEIRAGTGGDEAALFVADLFRMYSRYAEDNNWKVEVMSSNPIGIGGFKEIILATNPTVEGEALPSGWSRKTEQPVHKAYGSITS